MRGIDLIKEAYWKDGFHLKGDPKLVAARILEIDAKRGVCTREDVFKDATEDLRSPFRPAVYAKTDKEAAREWRLNESGKILQAIYYVQVSLTDSGPTSIQTPLVSYLPSREGYVLTSRMLSDDELRTERLQQIARELREIQVKLRDFKVLAEQNEKTIAKAEKLLARQSPEASA